MLGRIPKLGPEKKEASNFVLSHWAGSHLCLCLRSASSHLWECGVPALTLSQKGFRLGRGSRPSGCSLLQKGSVCISILQEEEAFSWPEKGECGDKSWASLGPMPAFPQGGQWKQALGLLDHSCLCFGGLGTRCPFSLGKALLQA